MTRYRANRRRDSTFYNKGRDENDALGQVDLRYNGHSMAPPIRHQATFTDNHVVRIEGMFMAMDTHGTPMFNTLADASLNDKAW